MKEQRTSLFVKNQLPKFITDEYPNFVLFLEAYYEFLENEQYIENVSQKNNLTEKLKNLRYLSDIDKSLSDFEDQFFNTFAPSLPRDSKVSKEFLIKHILELYNSKGSINSFKLLFRMLFGENVQIRYPKDNILRASDGRWVVESFLRVSPNIKSVHYGDGETVEFILAQEADDDVISVTVIDENNVTYDISFYIKLELKKLIFNTPPPVGSKIYITYEFFNVNNLINRKITGQQSGAYAIIEKIRNTLSYDSYYYQLFFNKKTLKGNFISGEKLYCDFFDDGRLIEIDLETLSSVAHLNIINRGASYNIGDPVIIVGDSVKQAIAIVDDVESGIIEDLGIINGGAGFQISSNIYSQNVSSEFFRAEVTTIDDTGTKTPNSITLNIDKIIDYNTVIISSSDYGFPNSTINLSSTIESALSYDTLTDLGGMTSVMVQNSTLESSLGFFGESPELQGIPIVNKGAIGKINIISGGSGYEVGDIIIFTRTFGDYSGNGASANVSLVDSTTGSIKRVTVIDGGEGYSREDFPDVSVNSVNGVGAVLQVTALMGEGATFNAMLPVDVNGRKKLAGEIKSFKILDQGVGYDTIPYVDLTGYGNGQALANVEINTSYEEIPGRWITSDSIISTEDRKLQGRDYYVDFTYILKSQVEFSKYKDILLKLIHPAGLRVYSEYDIVSDIDVRKDYNIESSVSLNTHLDLFAGTTGIWYDPQDIATMYQDAAGTLPVYLPGTGLVDPPMGLMLDKSQGLELGPELAIDITPEFRVYRTATESVNLAVCTLPSISIGTSYKVSVTVTDNVGRMSGEFRVGGGGGFFVANVGVNAGTNATIDGILIIKSTAPNASLTFNGNAPGTDMVVSEISVREIKGYHAYQAIPTARPKLSGRYNLMTATETLSTQSVTTAATDYTLRFEGTGTVTLSGTATGVLSAGTHTVTCTAGTLTCKVAGSVVRADMRVKRDGSSLPAYQRVDSATTYDTVGFPLYLKRDKLDDDLIVQAPAITGAWAHGTIDGPVIGTVDIPAGEYHPFGTKPILGLPDCTQWIAIDGALSESEQVVFERLVYSKARQFINVDQFGGVSTLENALQGRGEIKTIDTTTWDLSNNRNIRNTFNSCNNLVEIAGNKLVSSKTTTTGGCFISNNNLQSIDMSGWDTSALVSAYYMFGACSSLSSIVVGNAFDNTPCTDFGFAFFNTNLNQASIDAILVSINTAGTSNGTFNQSGGSAPSATGQAAITAMRSRGWTVTVTGGF